MYLNIQFFSMMLSDSLKKTTTQHRVPHIKLELSIIMFPFFFLSDGSETQNKKSKLNFLPIVISLI